MTDQDKAPKPPEFASLRLVEPVRAREPAIPDTARSGATPTHPAADLVRPLRTQLDRVLDTLTPRPGTEDDRQPHLTRSEARLVLETALDVLNKDKTRVFAPEREGVSVTHENDRSRSGTIQPGDYSFHASLSDKSMPDTIPGSRIQTMMVWDGGDRVVASYDRGWRDKPDPGSQDAAAVARVIDHSRDQLQKHMMARRKDGQGRDDDGRSR